MPQPFRGVSGSQDGTTPLHLAAWKDHIAFVRLLLSMGADVQVPSYLIEDRRVPELGLRRC